jgi:hypothetical protein
MKKCREISIIMSWYPEDALNAEVTDTLFTNCAMAMAGFGNVFQIIKINDIKSGIEIRVLSAHR